MRPCEPRNGMHVVRQIVGGGVAGFQIMRGDPEEWDRGGRRGAAQRRGRERWKLKLNGEWRMANGERRTAAARRA
ncbi:hypothetical protein CWD92_11520 [Burkholderia thailandensis]|nr:hypothetical protein CWD92_11520 [Burkholderia thailandensis]